MFIAIVVHMDHVYSIWRGAVMHEVCSYHIAVLQSMKMFHLQNRT